MSEGTVSELCRVLQKQGYRGDAVSVFADSLAYITHLEAQLAALATENAELKRQVEALREACKAADDAFDKLDPPKGTRCGTAWLKVLEALREAATKGGTEG